MAGPRQESSEALPEADAHYSNRDSVSQEILFEHISMSMKKVIKIYQIECYQCVID